MEWMRYAVYWLPDGPLGRAGAAWLGWDARAGTASDDPADGTDGPRKYGFHATVKPPFRLARGTDGAGLRDTARDLAAGLAPFDLCALRVSRLGPFLALMPEANPAALAAAFVEGLDAFRAPSPPEELARRRAPGLTPSQDALLRRWGYPYVMDEFRMHLTLTGPDPSDATEAAASAVFAPLAGPHRIEALSLVGEAPDGRFHLIEDLPLHGAPARNADSAAPTA